MEAAEFEGLWASMDADGNGELDLKELAAYYGFDMGGFGAHGMSDEQIWEMLKVRAEGGGGRGRGSGLRQTGSAPRRASSELGPPPLPSLDHSPPCRFAPRRSFKMRWLRRGGQTRCRSSPPKRRPRRRQQGARLAGSTA